VSTLVRSFLTTKHAHIQWLIYPYIWWPQLAQHAPSEK